jgi:oligosaccharide repeat unit polymerase
VLLLFSLGWTNHFVEPTPVGFATVFFGFFTAALAFFIARILSPRASILPLDQSIISANRFAKTLLLIWGVGSCIDIVYSGGIPLQWVVMGGEGKNYTDFGVPTLHGVLNACYLQAVTLLFLCWSVEKNKKYILLIGLLLLWPVMMLGRGIFLSAVVQMVAVYLLMHRVRVTAVIGIAVSAVILIVLFGVLGDLRDTPNPFDYLVEDQAKDLFDILPSGFLWVYVYATSSLNNFLANVDSVVPAGLPVYSMSNMFPSVIRTAFGMDPRNDLFEFVDQNLNTSTVYAGAVSDFGPIGGVILVYVIQQVASNYYSKAGSMDISGILGYSVMFQVLLFSVFYDMFFLLPTLMQLFLIAIGFNRCSK